MNSMVQPIAIVDVLQTLVGALEYAGQSRHFDVGGPDQLRYGELLKTYTEHAGLDRPQVNVPLLPTALVGTLAGSLTDVPRTTVEALVESLHHDMVVADDDFQTMLLPEGHRLVGLDEAIRRSLSRGAAVPERLRSDGSAAAGPGLGERWRRDSANPGQGGRRGQGRPAGFLLSASRPEPLRGRLRRTYIPMPTSSVRRAPWIASDSASSASKLFRSCAQ